MSDTWFEYIFFYKLPVTVSLATQKILLYDVPLVYFWFRWLYFWYCIHEMMAKTIVIKLFPCLFLGVLQFGILHLSPFWVDVWIWCEIGVQSGSFACGHSVFPTPFIEETSILHSVFLAPFLKISWLYAFISGLYILGHWCGFELVSYYFNY